MPETKEQWNRRKRVWLHNGLMGQIRRAQLAGMAVKKSDSTTIRAKKMGADIAIIAGLLLVELKTRIDK